VDDFLTSWWAIAAERTLAVLASVHVILHKRDVRAAIGWVGLISLVPVLGSVLYFVLGINRIKRRGGQLQDSLDEVRAQLVREVPPPTEAELEEARQTVPQLVQLEHLGRQLSGRTLLRGNTVELLDGGEQAYPSMLQAIENAEKSVALASYIFDYDRAGKEFVEALCAAHKRGVEVRVLIDDVGSRYSKPTSVSKLKERGILVDTFLKTRMPSSANYANLRNHRKIMVVDGRVGFTGGMNIREGCRGDWETDHPVKDVHFRFSGPVVSHFQEAIAADWAFTTGEILIGEKWFPNRFPKGDVWARGVPEGPDEDSDHLRLTILGAISVAQQSVTVFTPYFLPDAPIIKALNVAALRGVSVRIVLPEENNIKLVQWAATAQLWQVLQRGCRVFYSPPPFDHTKLMLVDNGWSLVGSTNWDPRSLRLNFEFNVECYSMELNRELTEFTEAKIAMAREITLEEVDARSITIRLRDGVARLFSPYL